MKFLTPTFEEARSRWLADRRSRNLRPDTLRSYLYQSNIFIKRFGPTRMGRISRRMAEDWLSGSGLALDSRKDVKSVVDQIWRFETGKPLFGRLPVVADQRPIKFYTVEQAGEMLACAPVNMRAYLALGLFGGLRPMEIERLNPGDIKEDGVIVSGEASKTRVARFIQPKTDNLMVFLRTYPLDTTNLRKRRESLCMGLGFDWIKDGNRHTFATYYSALYGVGEAATVLGHRSLNMLYRHYKGLASRSEAERFFRILPAVAAR